VSAKDGSSGPGGPSFRLDELASLGPFFALSGPEASSGSGWRPAAGLLDASELGPIIDAIAARLGASHGGASHGGASPRWVAASIFYQGWAARLTSIYAGSLALGAAVPDLSLTRLRYRLDDGRPAGLRADPLIEVDAATAWHRLSAGHLGPLADAVRGQVRLGAGVLQGNVASALAGSLSALARSDVAPLAKLAAQPWAQPAELTSCGHWARGPAGLTFRRANCCGYVQLPRAGRCGDCSLTWPE
jgi:hypothetical protein